MIAQGSAVVNSSHHFLPPAHTTAEVKEMKEEEKKPQPWEAVDPKPPVVQSGHMENRLKNERFRVM